MSARRGALPEGSPARRSYLLFAGQHGTAGGLRDFVALFHDEAAARRAFTETRLSTDHRAAWAELGRVDVTTAVATSGASPHPAGAYFAAAPSWSEQAQVGTALLAPHDTTGWSAGPKRLRRGA